MERWELESDEREGAEMNKRMRKNKQPNIILIGVLNKE